MSFRIFYYNKEYYKLVIDFLYLEENIKNTLEIRIGENYVFYKCSNSHILIKNIIV